LWQPIAVKSGFFRFRILMVSDRVSRWLVKLF
jgi:hypothetical protein